jgi:hypothetical protein
VTTDQLLRVHRPRPFQPFSLRLADGQRLRVQHPEMLAYSPKARTAVVYRSDGSFEIVDLLLLTGLDIHAPRNGKAAARDR